MAKAQISVVHVDGAQYSIEVVMGGVRVVASLSHRFSPALTPTEPIVFRIRTPIRDSPYDSASSALSSAVFALESSGWLPACRASIASYPPVEDVALHWTTTATVTVLADGGLLLPAVLAALTCALGGASLPTTLLDGDVVRVDTSAPPHPLLPQLMPAPAAAVALVLPGTPELVPSPSLPLVRRAGGQAALAEPAGDVTWYAATATTAQVIRAEGCGPVYAPADLGVVARQAASAAAQVEAALMALPTEKMVYIDIM